MQLLFHESKFVSNLEYNNNKIGRVPFYLIFFQEMKAATGRTEWLNVSRSCYVFVKSRVQIREMAFLSKVIHDFRICMQENSGDGVSN